MNRNGVKWSGYFAALCNSIDKMKTEQVMDPFEIVRLLRTSREQFIDQVSLLSNICIITTKFINYLYSRINMKIYSFQ